jgi:hypothetical protein
VAEHVAYVTDVGSLSSPSPCPSPRLRVRNRVRARLHGLVRHRGPAPSPVTGKLSDVAGLIFFPLLLAAVAQQLRPALGLRPTVRACALLTALVFASIKLWPLAGDAYRVGLGAVQWPFRAAWTALAGHGLPDLAPVMLTADPTDLLALPAALIAVWLARPDESRGSCAHLASGSDARPTYTPQNA